MKNVPRYKLNLVIEYGKPIANFIIDDNGSWIHFSDIKEILQDIAQQPLSGSADATPKSASQTSDNGKSCRTFEE